MSALEIMNENASAKEFHHGQDKRCEQSKPKTHCLSLLLPFDAKARGVRTTLLLPEHRNLGLATVVAEKRTAIGKNELLNTEITGQYYRSFCQRLFWPVYELELTNGALSLLR
jgi:hypothetical protein